MNKPTTADLIRRDISPTLTRLFIIFGMWGFVTRPVTYRRETYEEYVERLYGNRGRDFFLFLNYGLLLSVIALIVAVASLVVDVIT